MYIYKCMYICAFAHLLQVHNTGAIWWNAFYRGNFSLSAIIYALNMKYAYNKPAYVIGNDDER